MRKGYKVTLFSFNGLWPKVISQKLFIFIHEGLFTCKWGTSGRWATPARWGTPPNRGRLHLYPRRSLRDREHQEAEIGQCRKTSWSNVIIHFLFCLWIKPFWSRFNKVQLGFRHIFSFLLWSANDWNFVRSLVCLQLLLNSLVVTFSIECYDRLNFARIILILFHWNVRLK